MIPSIERDILIEAPVDVVWRAVTEPSQISSWFSDAAEVDLRAGGEGTLTWTDRATNKPATACITVQTIEPPHTFAFRWAYAEGVQPREGNSLLVEFTLTPEGENTRLRVIESGLQEMDWAEEQKATYADEHTQGWISHLSDLDAYVAQKRQASAR
jgi:uncharacterized protein YndB with AHSA1/START domain